VSPGRRAAQRRGAEERIRRREAALAELPEITQTEMRSGAKDTTATTVPAPNHGAGTNHGGP